jgi:predicted SAM-dependent methyltransferase
MRNLAIFGAGKIGKQTKKLVEEKYFNEYKLLYFVDNDPAKQGTSIEGTPVVSAEKLLELYKAGILDSITPALQNSYDINIFLIQQKIIPTCITPTRIFPLINNFRTERFCPICQKTSPYFNYAGLNSRLDALCPHCGSLERHRLVYLFLKEKTNFFTEQCHKKMLHIAPEPCLETLFKRHVAEYISADLYNPCAMVKMDIMDIQYENESFDIIYCSHVLEHVYDDRKAMKEFFRILKKDGWAILNVPITKDKTYEDPAITDPEEREKVFGQNDHVRAYGFDYVDRLREAGFSVAVTYAKDFLDSFDIERMGLGNSAEAGGEVYFCTISVSNNPYPL